MGSSNVFGRVVGVGGCSNLEVTTVGQGSLSTILLPVGLPGMGPSTGFGGAVEGEGGTGIVGTVGGGVGTVVPTGGQEPISSPLLSVGLPGMGPSTGFGRVVEGEGGTGIV